MAAIIRQKWNLKQNVCIFQTCYQQKHFSISYADSNSVCHTSKSDVITNLVGTADMKNSGDGDGSSNYGDTQG